MAALAILGSAGCNTPIEFFDPKPDSGIQATVDTGTDTAQPPPDGGTGGPDLRTGDDAPADTGIDLPQDIPVETGPDVPPDVTPDIRPDVPPDVAPDVPPDVQPDVQPDVRDTGVDTPRDAGLTPGTCNVEGDCHGGTHCDTAAHQCRECLTTIQCGTGRFCNTGLHRCVGCLSSTDCTTSTSPGEHASMCSTLDQTFQCILGCDDSPDTCPTGFTCNTSGLDHLCVECQVDANCTASPRGRFCINQRICAQCRGAGDCTPATPVCDVTTGRCVRCLATADCASTPATPFCSTTTFTCVQ